MMLQWKDDDTNFDAIAMETILNRTTTAVKCCEHPEFHVYGYVHSNGRGGLWAWCSNCRKFTHLDGVKFPNDFSNADGIELKYLCAVPDYLESKKSIVDAHLKDYLSKN